MELGSNSSGLRAITEQKRMYQLTRSQASTSRGTSHLQCSLSHTTSRCQKEENWMYPFIFPAGVAVRITGTTCFQAWATLKGTTGEISCPVFSIHYWLSAQTEYPKPVGMDTKQWTSAGTPYLQLEALTFENSDFFKKSWWTCKRIKVCWGFLPKL